MTAKLNENTQYTDPVTGELLVNGFIYIGGNNLDAKLNPITIYNDRDLTTPILNPQRTGSDGRAVNKIWIPGQYSMKVENFENVQKLNDLSLGSDTITGNSILINVSGTNLIIAEAESPASSLVNNQVYILTAANTNTGVMTLTIDSFPTYPIRKHHDVDMEAGDIEANQTMAIVWNETDSVFELFTNSAVVPLDVLHAQTAAGVKTFTDGIISDVTGNLTGDVTGHLAGNVTGNATGNVFDTTGNEILVGGATASAVNEITINNAATGNAPEIIPSGDDTNIDLRLSGKGTGRVIIPFRGCLVYLDANQSIPNSSGTSINFDQEDYDTDSVHDNITNNTRLTVPSGVTKVRLTARGYFATNSTGVRSLSINKNSGSYVGLAAASENSPSATSSDYINVISPVLIVAGGNYFELMAFQSSGGSLNLIGSASGTATWFAMEIIE